MQVLRPAERRALNRWPFNHAKVRQTTQQHFETNAQFCPGEVSTKAEVASQAEANVLPERPVDIPTVGIIESLRVPIGDGWGHPDQLPGPNFDA
jgi:hypothetical protein